MSTEPNEEERRTSYLELFFDLVLVFAITQLATLLHDVPHHHHGHEAAGWGQVGILAALIWWLWSQFAWTGSAVEFNRHLPRALMLGLTGLMLVAAVEIPTAFEPGVSVFGVTYALIKFGALILYRLDKMEHPAHAAAVNNYTLKASVAPVLVLIGAFLDPGGRTAAWVLALGVEIGGALLVGRQAFKVSSSHFSERHSLVLIVVLGEAVVALGGKAVAAELTVAGILGLLGGFGFVATLWWSYFAWAFGSGEAWLRGKGRPFPAGDPGAQGRMARDAFTFGHFPLVFGLIAMAVALKDLASAPLEPWQAPARLAMCAGLVLYLGGFVAVVIRGNGHVLWERLIALALMVIITAFSPLPAGLTAALLGAPLIAAIALEIRRWKRTHPAG